MYRFGLVFGDFNLNSVHRVFQSSTWFMDRYLALLVASLVVLLPSALLIARSRGMGR